MVEAGDDDRQGRRRAGAADGRRDRRAALPPRPSRARCSSARCACRRSARAGREASASCSPRPSAARRRARVGAASGRCASPRSAARARTITSFRLVPPGGRGATPAAAPGQYLTVRLRPAARDRPLTPQLLAVGPARRARLPDQRQARGRRQPLPARARPASAISVDVAAPRGSFVLRDGDRPVVLISAGVGATPVLAMLHALAGEHGARPVWWLHGARNRARARLRRRGRRAARRAPRRTPPRRLQPARRRRRTGPGMTSRAGSRSRRSRTAGVPERRRLLPLRARRLHARDRRRARPPRRRPGADRHRDLRRRRRRRLRASSRTGDRAPHADGGRRARARPSPSPRSNLTVAVGRRATRACSTSPRPATCPSASAAAPASATTARAACSPATSPTTPTRSSRRPTGASWSAAAARPASSRWTCKRPQSGVRVARLLPGAFAERLLEQPDHDADRCRARGQDR